MMVAAMEEHGADSFVGRLTSTIQGATDTTFYIIAVYFGAVGITKTRYAIKAGLLADLGGIIAAIVVSYMFFPTQQSTSKMTSLECTTQFVQSVRQNESSAATTYLNDQFVLYDMAYDTICFDNNKVDFVKMNLQPSNEILDVKIKQVADTCLVKIKKANGSYAYEYVMEKNKIKHVKYIGVF